jgi:hypothetical protein
MKNLFLILFIISFALPAVAEDIQIQDSSEVPSQLRLGIGARIGGYGFRHVNEEGNLDWTACRMDGTGIYASLEHGRLYGELATDFYHAIAGPQKQGIDRLSLHTTAAIGARFMPDSFISPHVLVGAGAEFTHVEMFNSRAFAIAPVGFIGVGGEINYQDWRFGMTIRSNAMQLPVYDWQEREQISWETEVSGQVLFSARYML